MPKKPPERRDLAARVQALEQALAAETQAREAAEAAGSAKSELLATVSHEVRTPLGAIISMAELLLATQLDASQRHYAETLQQSGRGLLAVLNDTLDHSKLEAGRFELEPVPFALAELMQSVAATVAARAEEKGLDNTLTIAPDCPGHVVGDPVRIRQVLDNLTDNALKFTETGCIGVAVDCDLEGADIVLRFEVRDTGIGLSDAQVERLFRPYAQADSSVAVKYGGTGLGLAIARQLAELMGGSLGCESTEGGGSVFWFTVRVAAAKAVDRFVEEGGARDTDFGPLRGHVLVVEDNDINQMLIAAYLEKFGVTFTAVKTGRDALRELRETTVDLVLMDIMMPELDGLQTTRFIRAMDGGAAKVPIIALTANAMKGDRESYLAAGMDDYVSKPVNAKDLFTAIAAFLRAAPDRRAKPA
ncbi:MAG: ATP-binding protein [Methyloligellaceae bacterium]